MEELFWIVLISTTCTIFSDIPLFGVLTHADQIDGNDEHFLKLEEKFKNSLGITNRRYLFCSSYCDEIPWIDHRNPNVEVPVIDFIMEVI